MSLLPGKREGGKEQQREKKKEKLSCPNTHWSHKYCSTLPLLHQSMLAIFIHTHFQQIFMTVQFIWMFFFPHWYTSEKWMIQFEHGLETVSLLICDLKRLCEYGLNPKQPAILFPYWASIKSLCWLFFYPAKQNKFLSEIQLCTGIVVINNRERFVCWGSVLFAQRATISFL